MTLDPNHYATLGYNDGYRDCDYEAPAGTNQACIDAYHAGYEAGQRDSFDAHVAASADDGDYDEDYGYDDYADGQYDDDPSPYSGN